MTAESAPTDVRSTALRLLSNGLYVLTTCVEDTLHSATVSWVTQVSVEPTLVLVALRRNSRLAQAVRQAHRFVLNILGEDQEALAERFFTHQIQPATETAIGGLPFRMDVGHCPLLTDALAWLECRLAAEPPSPGDHTLILGEVTGAGVRRPGRPLVLGMIPWSYGGVAR